MMHFRMTFYEYKKEKESSIVVFSLVEAQYARPDLPEVHLVVIFQQMCITIFTTVMSSLRMSLIPPLFL